MALVKIRENRCDRCDRRRPRDAGGWRANVSEGLITSVTCSECLSPEENIAMLVNEAVLELAYNRAGRIMVRPRTEEGQS
jgi:hypothetical protein